MGSSSIQAALMATLKSINVNPIREGNDKVDEGVAFEVILISPPGHENIHQGRQKGSCKVEWTSQM